MSEPTGEPLTHVGWYCWRCEGLVEQPCRSDSVPIHVPDDWAGDMQAEIRRLAEEPDDVDPETPPEPAGAPRSAVQPADGPAGARHAHDGAQSAQGGAGVPDEQPEQAETDMLAVEPYRNDQNQQRWAFRCWGTDTCDGWLGLGHDTKRWAEIARDRHVAEAHGEFTDEEARNRASDAYQHAVQRIESSGPKPGHDGGPSVQECAKDDDRWFGGEKDGE